MTLSKLTIIRKLYMFYFLNDKKALIKFDLRTWFTKKPFRYRFILH